MRLVKLENSWDCYITCYKCGQNTIWSTAVESGWVADLDGPAFRAYYCRGCNPENFTPPATVETVAEAPCPLLDWVAAGEELAAEQAEPRVCESCNRPVLAPDEVYCRPCSAMKSQVRYIRKSPMTPDEKWDAIERTMEEWRQAIEVCPECGKHPCQCCLRCAEPPGKCSCCPECGEPGCDNPAHSYYEQARRDNPNCLF